VLGRSAVALAKTVVFQNERQMMNWPERLQARGQVIRSGITFDRPSRHDCRRDRVLWVGSLKPLKRPEIFVDVARACSTLHFVLAGTGKPSYDAKVRSDAADLHNLEFVGRLRHAEVQEALERSLALVVTSQYEGVPNVMIEAWHAGTPTLTLGIEPVADMEALGVGFACTTVEQIRDRLRQLDCDRGLLSKMSCRARFLASRDYSAGAVQCKHTALVRRVRGGTQRV